MHIGFLVADLSPRHGWGRYSIELPRALAQAGARVSVVTSRNSQPQADLELHPHLPDLMPGIRGIPMRLWLARGPVARALQDCHLIHAAVEPFALLAGWCAERRPYFITGHGTSVNSLLKKKNVRGSLYRRAFTGAARVICVSNYTESRLLANLPTARSCVIFNGVNSALFADMNHAPVADRPPTVLAVGAVKPRKGMLPLVEAIAIAREEIPDLRCVVIGETVSSPAYVSQVRAAIERLSLADTVQLVSVVDRLTGVVDEQTLLAHYLSADIFCLPTQQVSDDFDSFSLVYLEAGLAGLPVIATDAGGVGDAVVDGVNGLLLPAAEVAERLPAALVSLVRDRERARQLGEGGRERALSLSWDTIAQRYLAIYEEELRAASHAG